MVTQSLNIHFSQVAHPNGVYELSFNMDGNRAANLFTPQTLCELDAQLSDLESKDDLRAIIFTSAKSKIFIAGADISLFSDAFAEGTLGNLIELGQGVFQRISEMKCITVAAIHGACLGGGYELALACDYRVASDDRATKVGLPEVQLGILPGWGGSVRLPKQIGIMKAMSVILAGKVMPAKKAWKMGMVDAICPPECLFKKAIKMAQQKKPVAPTFSLQHNLIALRAIGAKARKQLLAKTHGNYPAPLAALDVMLKSVRLETREGLRLEKEAINTLSTTDVCANLLRIFFMNEDAKKKKWKALSVSLPAEKHVAVIGAGVMGAGIAHWNASKGAHTILKDISPQLVAKGMNTVSTFFNSGVKRRRLTKVQAKAGMEHVIPVAQDVPMHHVDFVIEAVVEKMSIKKQVFANLEKLLEPDAVLATNTSALSVSEIAKDLEHPERLIGIHFFNPVHRMPLVEIVRSEYTSDETVARAIKYVHFLGKTPVVVFDRPGFLVNRVLMPYVQRALLECQDGISPKEMDAALLKFGMPMGPIRLADEVGLDVVKHVGDYLGENLEGRDQACQTLESLIEKGELGKKTGSGYYEYENGKSKGINPHLKIHPQKFDYHESLCDRLIFPMVNEALACLEEEVVASVEDVDLGMIMGTGWAPFRGGPIAYGEKIGFDRVYEAMAQTCLDDPRYPQPCTLLKTLAKDPQVLSTYKNNN